MQGSVSRVCGVGWWGQVRPDMHGFEPARGQARAGTGKIVGVR